MKPRIHSTLGFLFTSDFKHVLLIKKHKPAFHKDKLNGLGGKLEKDEGVLECIVREVEEETSLKTQQKDWVKVGTLEWDEWRVEILTATVVEKYEKLKNLGDEEIGWYEVENLPDNVLTNLPWLIPMCVDKLKNGSAFNVGVKYQ